MVEDAKKKANKLNLDDIGTQIKSKEEVKKSERKNYLEEGRKVR